MGKGGEGLKRGQQQAARQEKVSQESKVRRATSHLEERKPREDG